MRFPPCCSHRVAAIFPAAARFAPHGFAKPSLSAARASARHDR
jgi:hypothetical protein